MSASARPYAAAHPQRPAARSAGSRGVRLRAYRHGQSLRCRLVVAVSLLVVSLYFTLREASVTTSRVGPCS